MTNEEVTCVLSILDGDPISQLSNCNEISAKDLFLIARPEVHDKILDKIVTEKFIDDVILEHEFSEVSNLITEHIVEILKRVVHLDYKITYDELSTQLLNDVSAAFNFNTMAYRDYWEYARRLHTHDYNKVKCYPNYTSADVMSQYVDKPTISNPHDLDEWLGTIEIYQLSTLCVGVDIYDRNILSNCYIPISTDIYMPHIEFPKYKDLEVGEVRFLGINSFPNSETGNPKVEVYNGKEILYDNQTSGYWSYLNGQTIECSRDEFTAACKVYGNNGKTGLDTSFSIPTISNFIKLNPGIWSNDSMSCIPYKLSLPIHTHTIEPDIFKESVHNLSTYARFFARPNAGYVSGPHAIHTYDYPGGNPHAYPGKLSAEAFNSDLQANPVYSSINGDDFEVYPTFNSIPTIVYIGKK